MPKTMNEQDLELYEAYLDNTLDIEAKREFETKLTADQTFKKNFERYKETVAFLSEKFDDSEEQKVFELNLAEVSSEYFGKKTKTSFKSEIWKYAAAIVLLISLGGYLLMNQSRPQYNDYVTTPSIALAQRSGADAMAKKAEDAFNSKSFNEATKYLSDLLNKDSSNQELLLYRGIAQIETNAFNAAYQDLNKVSAGTSVYKHEALWYKALGLLKQKEYDACRKVLAEIPATSEVYEKAQDLLKDL